jgi:hypothetical protein
MPVYAPVPPLVSSSPGLIRTGYMPVYAPVSVYISDRLLRIHSDVACNFCFLTYLILIPKNLPEE